MPAKQLKYTIQDLARGLDNPNYNNFHAVRDFNVEWAQCGRANKAKAQMSYLKSRSAIIDAKKQKKQLTFIFQNVWKILKKYTQENTQENTLTHDFTNKFEYRSWK